MGIYWVDSIRLIDNNIQGNMEGLVYSLWILYGQYYVNQKKFGLFSIYVLKLFIYNYKRNN